jgi:hypothetical protein
MTFFTFSPITTQPLDGGGRACLQAGMRERLERLLPWQLWIDRLMAPHIRRPDQFHIPIDHLSEVDKGLWESFLIKLEVPCNGLHFIGFQPVPYLCLI